MTAANAPTAIAIFASVLSDESVKNPTCSERGGISKRAVHSAINDPFSDVRNRKTLISLYQKYSDTPIFFLP